MMLAVGVAGILAVVSLLLFLVGLFQNIASLAFMGRPNDTINFLGSLLSAVLASALHPGLRRVAPRSSPVLLIGVWVGAAAVAFGSWLIMTDRADALPAGRYASLIYSGGGISANRALIEWVRAKGMDFDRWDTKQGDNFRGRYECYLTDPKVEPCKSKWKIEVAIKPAED
jgi:hypothetical protein